MMTSSILLALIMILSKHTRSYQVMDYQADRAHKLSRYGQLVTSSNLGWVEAERLKGSERIVRVGDRGVCRQRLAGYTVPGVLDGGGYCVTAQGDNVQVVSHGHQVLVDLWGRARYQWIYWDMFTQPPIDTVGYTHKAGVYILTELNLKILKSGPEEPF